MAQDLDGQEPSQGLSRSLTRLDLLVIGVAQIIGAGIFVISGVGVKIAGPGIILSFLLAGLACTLVSPCLMLSMPASSWWRLALWLLAGLAIYFLYASSSSRRPSPENHNPT